jgi:hypothetical protein
MDALVAGTHNATRSSREQLRAGDRVADAYTLRETGTVIDTDPDRAAVVWDRTANGWHTYSADTLRLVNRLDAHRARLELERATAVAHLDA